jgi:hypothetical protein
MQIGKYHIFTKLNETRFLFSRNGMKQVSNFQKWDEAHFLFSKNWISTLLIFEKMVEANFLFSDCDET